MIFDAILNIFRKPYERRMYEFGAYLKEKGESYKIDKYLGCIRIYRKDREYFFVFREDCTAYVTSFDLKKFRYSCLPAAKEFCEQMTNDDKYFLEYFIENENSLTAQFGGKNVLQKGCGKSCFDTFLLFYGELQETMPLFDQF